MNMPTICFISNLFPSKSDPTFGSFVENSYQQLEKMGYYLRPPIVIDGRLKSVKKLLAYFKFIFSGLCALTLQKNDLYYFHYLTYSTLSLLPVLPFKKVKYIVNIHGDDLVGARLIHKIMGLPSSYILKHSVKVIVPSNYFKQKVLSLHPHISEKKIIISPSSGINSDIFYPKELVQKNDKKIHFGYVSRIDEGKGWQIMLQAISILKTDSPNLYKNLKLSVYGKGNQTKELTDMINNLNINETVTYYGAAQHRDLGAIFRSFDYFLFPTIRESLGLVAIEALACGTPVICSDIEPLTEFVVEGKNGHLFKKNSATQLSKNIEACYSISSDEYHNLANNSIQSVQDFESSKVMHDLNQNIRNCHLN